MASERPLLRPEASVSQSSVVVSASFLLTALLGAGQALLLVFIIGEGDKTDAFLAAYSLYVVFAVLGGSMRISIMPLLGTADSDEQLRERASELVSRVLLMGVVVLAGLAAVSPLTGQLLTLGLPSQARWTAVLTLLILAPAAFLQLYSAALSAALGGARRFHFSATLYTAASAVALACSAALLVLIGVLGAALGLLAGAIFLAGGHTVYLRRFGVRPRPRLSWLGDSGQRKMAVFVLAAASLSVALQVDLAVALASLSSNPGAITAYSYAFFLISLMLAISSMPLSLVSMPDLVSGIAERGMAAAREYLLRVAPYAFAVAAPLLGAYAMDGKQMLEALFGSSLSQESVDLLYQLGLVLGIMTIPTGLLFLGGAVTLALRQAHRFLAVAAAGVGIQVAIVLPLSSVGPTAVAAGHVAALTATAALLLRSTFGRGWPGLALDALRRSAPAFALAAVFVPIRLPLGSDPGVLAASAAAIAGLVAYGGLALLLWPSVSRAFVDLVRNRRAGATT